MAIAFDNATDGTNTTSYSHTCTGANLGLFVVVRGNTTDDGATVTYNSISMTQVTKIQIPADRWMYLFYLSNPATGANTVAITGTTNRTIACSYTGVKQSGQPEANNTNTASTVTAGNPFTTSVTTVTNNAWVVGVSDCLSGNIAVNAGTTSRVISALNFMFCDKNADQSPAGSYSTSVKSDASSNFAGIAVSIAPASASTSLPYRSLMGVGI